MVKELSARNHLEGEVTDVDIGVVGAKIKIDTGANKVTAFITKEGAEELDIKEGDDVKAVIKATEVMVSKS
ncbi:MAG: Molybdopterin-binding protein MopI [Candidatus Methanohalarchaeum thermophilum]|uniref:Molybdopterin-binding protein MopI n=1 Tax=Methanohalarchaeum thermophilum TaxID=1903181 RepID=A0A1Q6DVX3_METT1|nr:MAG: Molybdopterin-binding protein MopI [Candidatus Methanohalarchaeum thermophilum]